MSYQVLARKWRPRSFAEVAAKCLNCEEGVSATPCGRCRACTEIDEGRFLDLIEIDAASRTGVDDTRELLDNVAYAPGVGRYKVYLIDEVHMFSRSSFNALLKTLEEPPEHVKFVLATTDPQKVPVTVLSRCLQFNLKRFPPSTIANQLQRVLEAESIAFDRVALDTLAQAGEGSMRDAMSLLDQALAFGGGAVSADDVQRMLGAVDESARFDLLEAVARGDAPGVLAKVAALDDYAPDYEALLGDLISLLHATSIQQSVPEVAEHPVSDLARLQALALAMRPEDVQLNYQIGLMGRRDLPLVPVARQGFEMTLLRMIAFRPGSAPDSGSASASSAVADNQPAGSRAGGQSPADQARAAVASPRRPAATRSADPAPKPSPNAQPEQAISQTQEAPQTVGAAPVDAGVSSTVASGAVDAALPLSADTWTETVTAIAVKGMPLQLAMHSVPTQVAGDTVTLSLPEAHQHLAAASFVERLRAALEAHLGRAIKLSVTLGAAASASPAQQHQRDAESRQREAEQAIYNDPVVQQLQNRFDAEVQPDSIRPLDDLPGDER